MPRLNNCVKVFSIKVTLCNILTKSSHQGTGQSQENNTLCWMQQYGKATRSKRRVVHQDVDNIDELLYISFDWAPCFLPMWFIYDILDRHCYLTGPHASTPMRVVYQVVESPNVGCISGGRIPQCGLYIGWQNPPNVGCISGGRIPPMWVVYRVVESPQCRLYIWWQNPPNVGCILGGRIPPMWVVYQAVESPQCGFCIRQLTDTVVPQL